MNFIKNAEGSDDSLQAYQEEVGQLLDQMLQLANTRDANGDYLFAGGKGDTIPFVRAGNDFVYQGDQTEQFLQIGTSTQVQTANNGLDVFAAVRKGNGHFQVSGGYLDTSVANPVFPDNLIRNAGTGIVDPGSVVDMTEFNTKFTEPYYIVFPANLDTDGDTVPDANLNGNADTYLIVRDPTDPLNTIVEDPPNPLGPAIPANQIPPAAYEDGGAISFYGVNTKITGQPEPGDVFELRPSANESLFKTLQNLQQALEIGNDNPQNTTDMYNRINDVLSGLSQQQTHVSNIRATVGARLQAVDVQREQNSAVQFEYEKAVSNIKDLDMAEAISRLNFDLASLQAAQQSFAKVQGLSLFDYIR